MPFPSPPWKLRGDLWVSLFPIASSGTAHHPPGLYGAAFVDYREGGVLSYRELLTARLVRDGAVPRVHITEIWVDSETSRTGGRALWAIPKEQAALSIRDRRLALAARTSCDAALSGAPIAAARFTGAAVPSPRTPVLMSVRQQREDGTTVVAGVSGSARTLPCVGHWDFGADGPLAWLRGRRPVVSFHLSDFRITFGG